MQQDRERAAAQGVARRMASGMGNPAKSVWGCSRQLKAPRTVPPSPARSRIFRLAQNHVVLARSRAQGKPGDTGQGRGQQHGNRGQPGRQKMKLF